MELHVHDFILKDKFQQPYPQKKKEYSVKWSMYNVYYTLRDEISFNTPSGKHSEFRRPNTLIVRKWLYFSFSIAHRVMRCAC